MYACYQIFKASWSRCGGWISYWLPARPLDKPRGVCTIATDHRRTQNCWAYRKQGAGQWGTKNPDSCVHVWLHSVLLILLNHVCIWHCQLVPQCNCSYLWGLCHSLFFLYSLICQVHVWSKNHHVFKNCTCVLKVMRVIFSPLKSILFIVVLRQLLKILSFPHHVLLLFVTHLKLASFIYVYNAFCLLDET